MSFIGSPQGLLSVGINSPDQIASVLCLPVDLKRDFGASGSNASTTGSITSGSTTLSVASAIDFQNGQGIQVAGAGASGALLVTSIVSGAGTPNLVLASAAGTTVTTAAVNHNDRVAITNAIAGGGAIGIPAGNYLHDGFTIPDATTIVCHNDAILWGSGSIVIGSKSAISTAIYAQLRVAAQSGSSITLVETYNLQYGRGFFPVIGIQLAANAETSDLLHCHSTNALGHADITFNATTAGFTCNNGIVLENGDSSIASVAGDFVNGNVFMKPDLSCNIICAAFTPVGSASGSVTGNIERNLFMRGDMSSYNTAAVKSLSAGNVGYNRFQDCTFETGGGGAPLDVDLTTNSCPTGQIFDHIASRGYSSQKLNPRDVWILGENDTTNYWGWV